MSCYSSGVYTYNTSMWCDLNYSLIIFGEEVDYCSIKKEIIIYKKNYHARSGDQWIVNPKQLCLGVLEELTYMFVIKILENISRNTFKLKIKNLE